MKSSLFILSIISAALAGPIVQETSLVSNRTAPPMPDWMIGNELIAINGVKLARKLVDQLLTLLIKQGTSLRKAGNVGLSYTTYAVSNGGNMYLGVGNINGQYDGITFPNPSIAQCTDGTSGNNKYMVPITKPGTTYRESLNMWDFKNRKTILAANMQIAANTPASTYVQDFCFVMGTGTTKNNADKPHDICMNQAMLHICAVYTNRWVDTTLFGSIVPFTFFSTESQLAPHSISINNDPNMVQWEDDLLNSDDPSNSLWNYCYTINASFGTYNGDGDFEGAYQDKSGLKTKVRGNQWVNPNSCTPTGRSRWAEIPESDNSTSIIDIPEIVAEKEEAKKEREEIAKLLDEFKALRAKYAPEEVKEQSKETKDKISNLLQKFKE